MHKNDTLSATKYISFELIASQILTYTLSHTVYTLTHTGAPLVLILEIN